MLLWLFVVDSIYFILYCIHFEGKLIVNCYKEPFRTINSTCFQKLWAFALFEFLYKEKKLCSKDELSDSDIINI